MSTQRTANIIYRALRSNAVAVAAMRTELSTLALAIANDPEYGRELTSATVNGQSYAGTVSMTNQQRLALLDTVITHIDAGVQPSTRSYAQF